MIKRYSSMFNCNQNYHKYKKNIKYGFKDLISKVRSRISKTKKEILYNGQQKRTKQKAILYIYVKVMSSNPVNG